MISLFINFIAIVFLGIIQVSFLTTWPQPVSNLNLILSLVIFLTISSYFRQGLWWAFFGGLFLELFSFKIFGLTTLGLLLTAIIINFLFNNFFTNYSFYSLTILGLIGTLSYNLLTFLGGMVFNLFGLDGLALKAATFFHYLTWQLILNLVILYVIFFTVHFLKSKLRINFFG